MKPYKIGITFGAFDPLHYGHIRLIQRAKEQCDYLVVALSKPEYIQEYKGHPERVPYYDRLLALQSLKEVDMVVPQDDDTFSKHANIIVHNPSVIFVGDDWTPETFTGEGLGVPVVYLPHTEGMSSTNLVTSA